MKTIQTLTTAAIAAAAMTVAAGTAHADVAAAPDGTTAAPSIDYAAQVVDHSVVLHTNAGSLVTRDNKIEILDGRGNLAFGMPLTYQLDQRTWPIAARVDADGHRVVLTPSRGEAASIAADVHDEQPGISQDDFNDALGVFGTELGVGTGLGVLIGTAIGLIGGCVAGAVLVGDVMPPLFFAGAPGGCIAGAIAGAGLGTALGTVGVGGPVAIAGAIQMFNTLTHPEAK